jgi:hypothetical protein
MARALVALGRKPDYQQINRYITHIEPLLIDYCEHWLDREPPDGWRAGDRSARGWRSTRRTCRSLQTRAFRSAVAW